MNREDFPILRGSNLVYFDNGATTLKPECVLDIVNSYNSKFTANAHRGDYKNSLIVDNLYDGTREKVMNFINSKEKFLYIHGFMGTGKRQFINYICEFLNKDVILLEFFCKEATVCDDILLIFNNILELVISILVSSGHNVRRIFLEILFDF